MWLLERDFWLIASDWTIFSNAVYYLFPLLATLAAWRRDGVTHFKLLFFYSFAGWSWMWLTYESWLRDLRAVQQPNGSGLFSPGTQEGFLVTFFGFMLSLCYYVSWQAVLLLPREVFRAWRREMTSPWRRMLRSSRASSAEASPSREFTGRLN